MRIYLKYYVQFRVPPGCNFPLPSLEQRFQISSLSRGAILKVVWIVQILQILQILSCYGGEGTTVTAFHLVNQGLKAMKAMMAMPSYLMNFKIFIFVNQGTSPTQNFTIEASGINLCENPEI
jgi:hypothetical protein